MANIGAEVGQKMRSAIKAKLLELNCYVDDELPDYVMVMVANKRTKSQMKEDLQLFLSSKTATFVDWLHIVLKKLKEVTVTNPDVYKKTTTKRKADEISVATSLMIKKEKREKKTDKKVKDEDQELATSNISESFPSLTDDLPINPNKLLSKQRKIVVMKETAPSSSSNSKDNFDIPLLSEVNMSTEEELEDIERKIKTVKSRLGLMVESDEDEENEDKVVPKVENKEKRTENAPSAPRKIQIVASTSSDKDDGGNTPPRKPERTRITFTDTEPEASKRTTRPKSILSRLGKRRSSSSSRKADYSSSSQKKRRDTTPERRDRSRKDDHRDRDRAKNKEPSILSRLGVMSKVSIPNKPPEEPEEPPRAREVQSVVKIKPRVIPQDAPQPNKNLLLKAMAEAQRSIAQTPKVGHLKMDGLFTKKFKETQSSKSGKEVKKRLTASEKQKKLNEILASVSDDDNNKQVEEANEKYVPKPNRKANLNQDQIKYVPSSSKKSNLPDDEYSLLINNDEEDLENDNNDKQPHVENGSQQKFIITLDGIEKTKFKNLQVEEQPEKVSIKSRLDKKKSPSPIIFGQTNNEKDIEVEKKSAGKQKIPDKLPLVMNTSLTSLKNKERCKYWPNCRHGDKCEFVHPTTSCDKFPHCKFGDKCLYLHPNCKFGNTCTRRGCVYSHGNKMAAISNVISTTSPQCKFYPNCTNLNCPFYHPQAACKFGKFCKNQAECNFSHVGSNLVPSKSSLTWRSK